jgi:formamidopyrimidine-DNA glycosylase
VPELPEVETMRRIVERELVGRMVSAVELTLPKLLRDSPLTNLDRLVGRRVQSARRRAKLLVIDWSDDLSWLLHFKLAGQLAVFHPNGARQVAGHPVPNPAGPYPHKATHLIVHFTDATTLYLSDIRQFGWLRMMPTADIDAAIGAFGFGPEGTGADAIALVDLAARLARRRVPLKTALLDQTVVAGLGNIYVDEALHRARLHPTRAASSLTAEELDRLHEAIIWSLDQGIAQGGAKIIHGRAYPRDNFPSVHGRANEPCFTCATPIAKIRVGARGTYLCPTCQPDEGIGVRG